MRASSNIANAVGYRFAERGIGNQCISLSFLQDRRKKIDFASAQRIGVTWCVPIAAEDRYASERNGYFAQTFAVYLAVLQAAAIEHVLQPVPPAGCRFRATIGTTTSFHGVGEFAKLNFRVVGTGELLSDAFNLGRYFAQEIKVKANRHQRDVQPPIKEASSFCCSKRSTQAS